MKGLKQTLHDEIKRRGYISIDDIAIICKETHHKISNAERRLRHSDSPDIEGVDKYGKEAKNNEPIVGYRMKQSEQKLFELPEEERHPSVIF